MSAEPDIHASFSPGRRFQGALHAFVGVAAVLALVIMANYLAGRHGGRWFVSTQTELRLSPQTRGLLRAITNDITVTVFYDRKDPFFNTVKGLLREYELANSRVRVRDVDYLRDAGAAQQVFAQYQLAGTTNKNLIIFACGTNALAVPGDGLVHNIVRQLGGTERPEFERKPVAFYGEKAFTVAILAVTSPKPLKACFLTGHDEHSAESPHETQGYAKFGALLRQNVISTLPLSLAGTNAVPDDCNLLVIAGPLRAIPSAELDKIEQYLTQGGRLLALFNSYSSPRQCGLESVLAKWGVQVSTPAVADPDNSTRKAGADVKAWRFNAHPLVQPLLQSSAPAALHLWQPRAVVRQPVTSPGADAPTVAEVVLSGEAATLGNPPATRAGGWSLVVAVEKGAVKGVVTERGTTRMVVVGDSFFLGNQMIESANNADFAAHAVNWLLDRSHLLHSLGPKPVTEFRLTLSVAQLRWLRWTLLAGLPGAVLLLGGLVWLRRRS